LSGTNRAQNVCVAGAPTKIPGKIFPDLLVGRVPILFKKGFDG